MEREYYNLINDNVKRNAINRINGLPVDSKKPLVICIQEMTRTIDQNARLWATLTDISKQVVWHGAKLKPEDWKHIFSATLKGQHSVPNLDGTGFIILGKSTSTMSKRELSDLLELAYAFGSENGVNWSEKAKSDLIMFDWYKDQLSRVK